MSRSSTFPLYNKISRGRLEGRLRTMRARGMSYDRMAEQLRPAIDVNPSTIFRWCRELGIDQERAPS